jgi:hypothetical protein
LKKTIKIKTIITLAIIAAIISLGSIGTNWKIGFAATNPTIPFVTSVTPSSLCVGSGDVNVTLTGRNFIIYEGTYYTSISWLGPGDTSPSTIEPEYISEDETILRFWVEASKLTEAGTALVVVVNHPELEDPFELASFYMDINHCTYIPLIMK